MQQHSGHHVLQWSPDKKHSEIERYVNLFVIFHMLIIHFLDGFASILHTSTVKRLLHKAEK